ncbi:MADF domain-containing protein [Aphelenchoides besseyi]|nr:MADF domain-containing protein [Aphelenchoides besseyi]KAI6211712.1 MADF domain-containing protein [Aphelenchoides besseyi]
MSARFDADEKLELVELMRSYPEIWDQRHVDYKSRKHRSDSFGQLAEKMSQKFGKNFDVEMLKESWKNLKTTYHMYRKGRRGNGHSDESTNWPIHIAKMNFLAGEEHGPCTSTFDPLTDHKRSPSPVNSQLLLSLLQHAKRARIEEPPASESSSLLTEPFLLETQNLYRKLETSWCPALALSMKREIQRVTEKYEDVMLGVTAKSGEANGLQ